MMTFRRGLFSLLFAGTVSLDAAAETPFVVEVVDSATGRGVPLVELRTVHEVAYHTDNAGLIVVNDPELIGTEVFFHVRSHGYEYKKDGFGYRGVRLEVKPGAMARIEIDRTNLAERLYRITGAGLYDHSIAAGRNSPLTEPLLNTRVFGSDSVLNAIWKGKLFWVWGDTNRPGYPLGNFQVTAALSDLPANGGLDPAVGVDLNYFKGEKGFVKKIAPLPGEGPTWLSGLAVLRDEDGREHLVAHFVKVKGFLEVYRKGLCEWDKQTAEFREVLVFPEDQELTPHGHSFRETVDGTDYLIFADPTPTLRIPATYEAWKNPGRYEELKTSEDFHDADTKKRVQPHRGSLAWNDYRKRWIMIFTETGGEPSHLGEVWFAEAKEWRGPWTKCVRIVSHDRYSFYNPKQHPYFSAKGDQWIYFEGTYTATFSKNPRKTPKYNYNQIMYRLDLDDERLLPALAK